MKKHLSTLSLFTSFSTIICCAMPALLVTLGLGATLASIVSAVPALIWISEYKIGIFIFSGLMLTFTGVVKYITRNEPCPIDPKIAKECSKVKNVSNYIYGTSLVIYLIGFFFAFIAVRIFN